MSNKINHPNCLILRRRHWLLMVIFQIVTVALSCSEQICLYEWIFLWPSAPLLKKRLWRISRLEGGLSNYTLHWCWLGQGHHHLSLLVFHLTHHLVITNQPTDHLAAAAAVHSYNGFCYFQLAGMEEIETLEKVFIWLFFIWFVHSLSWFSLFVLIFFWLLQLLASEDWGRMKGHFLSGSVQWWKWGECW